MKNRDMYIFFIIVFIIYFSANAYIFIRGYRALQGYISTGLFSASFILLAFTFIIGKILERNSSSVVADILNVTGGFWLACMLYAFLLLLITDIVYLGGRLAGLITVENTGLFRFRAFAGVTVITLTLIIAGFINAVTPVARNYKIKIKGSTTDNKPVRIVAVSDIHLGSVVRKRSLRTLSGMIRDARPDIVFFLGDIVDGEINPVLREDLLESLSLPPEAEIVAITGNHEFIGDFSKTVPYIESKGINILLDEVITLKSGIQVVGRIDRDSFRFSGKRRKELEEILNLTDPTKPVIILDHQPPGKGSKPGGEFDLMLSGHTHNGQLWPFSLIVKSLYHPWWGLYTEGRRNWLVSSGFGTWGPRVRIGSRSEIVIIDLEPGKSDK